MPLDNYFTKPDFSRQIKQYSGTTAILSGETNILEKFSIKSIEVDTYGAILGDALLYDAGNNKFRPGFPGSFSGSVISNGFLLTYVSGLTYSVGAGSYNVNGTPYPHNLEYINIISGQSGGSRFDLVYITAASPTVFIRTGITTTNPTLPNLQVSELEVGYIFVPANFTGGTGSTTIQTTADTVFVYFNNGSGTGVQRAAGAANAAGSGDYSFATGVNSRAYGYNSNAFGYETRASGYSQTVVGQYNVDNTTDLFIVGAGIADLSRLNAFNVTNSGDTYANKRLFVTNVEIETTGTTGSGQVLKFDGTKFKPQLETITGLTLFTGGTNFISSITSNSLLVKALTGSTGITVTDSNGLITIGLNFSGTNVVTDIVSLTGGTSIISAKTGTTYFLYPIDGAGGTSVTLVNGKIIVYSDTSGSTTGENVGAGGAGVFKTKAVNKLQFRRLSSATSSYLTIDESDGINELVLFTSTPPITGSTNATGSSIGVLASVSNKNIVGRALTGTNRASVTQLDDLITINSPIEVDTGGAGVLSIYRTASPIVYSSYTSTNNSGITVKLGTHTVPITSRTYTIPDVKKDANFVMTEGNQSINGKKDFITGFTVGYNGNTNFEFTNYDYSTPGTAPNSYYVYAPKEPLYSLTIDYSTSALTSQQINLNVSYTGTTFYGIDITTYTASTGTSYNSPISWSVYYQPNSIDYYLGDSFNMIVSGYNETLETSLISYTSYTYTANTILSNTQGNILFNNVWAGKTTNLLRAKSLLIEGVSPIRIPKSAFTINSGITILKTTNIGPPIISESGEYSGSIIGNLTRVSLGGNSNNNNVPFNNLTGTFVGQSQENNLASTQGYKQKLIGTYLENYAATSFVGNTYDTIKTLAFGFRSNVIAGVGSKSIFDIYIYKPLVGPGYGAIQTTNSAAIYIEGKKILHSNSIESDLYNRPTSTSSLGMSYTNAPWSLFAEGDRAYIGSTLVLYSGLTLSSTTRGAWLDIGNATTSRPQINLASGGTAPTTPKLGDIWFENSSGPKLQFRLASSTINLLAGFSGATISAASIGSSEGGGIDVYKTTTGDTLYFRSISSSNSSYISITQVGDLIVFSGGPGITGLSLNDLVFSAQTTSGFSLFDTIQPYQIYYKNLSAGTGIDLSDNGEGLITINSTVTGGTSSTGLTTGTNLGDGVKVLFSSNTTNLGFATLSSQTPSTLRIISSSTGLILFSATTGSGIVGTLDQVTTAGNTTTNPILIGDLSANTIFLFNTNNSGYNKIEADGGGYNFYNEFSTSVIFSAIEDSPSYKIGIGNSGTQGFIVNSGLTVDRNYYLPDKNGTFALEPIGTQNIPVTSQVAQVGSFYLYDKITITSATPSVTVTAITSDVSISAYTPSIKFFANAGVTVTFQNSATLKTEGGLDAVIVGDNYDSITFTYNNDIQKYFQTNINNYI